MTTPLFVLLLIAIVLAVYAGIAVVTWARYRGTRVVTCPETQNPAAVRVDVGHAAVTAVWERADVKLACCSRWPEREGCDEGCVPQILEAQDETRVRTLAQRFYAGKRCAICQYEISPLHAGTLQPGLLQPVTHEAAAWDEIPADDLPGAFLARRAICANCTAAESFRRRYPDRVVERAPRPDSFVH